VRFRLAVPPHPAPSPFGTDTWISNPCLADALFRRSKPGLPIAAA
jgi:hypothetical protein